ncbi:MAG TPA: hypothetical protein PKE19_09565 [Aestuariivirga sp.]|nr:hypothetical protein [Aestuariivirga sp.]
MADPLGTVRVCCAMVRELEDCGLKIEASSDLMALGDVRKAARGSSVSPYFDPEVTELSPDRTFWMKATDGNGTVMGLQAFRLDEVATSLADWGISYFIGVYMRRQELMVPSHPAPPVGSIAERLKGRLVYHGELWFNPAAKNRRAFERFSRLGLLLCLVKWNPDAMWGLTSHQMAAHGHVGRIGYTHLERGFQRWLWKSDGIDPVEYLAVAERGTLEQMVAEERTTKPESPPCTPR